MHVYIYIYIYTRISNDNTQYTNSVTNHTNTSTHIYKANYEINLSWKLVGHRRKVPLTIAWL